jgi:hypothetical protein
MFNPSSIVANAFGNHLAETYQQYFAGAKPNYATIIGGAAQLVLERLGNSDALYHNAEHTMMVTLVGQQIMLGRLVTEPIKSEDWAHYILALLMHDIGYARGICAGDTDKEAVINHNGNTITPPRGASDAYLAPYHVDRGKLYVRARFRDIEPVNEDRIAACIEYTRFPVPDDPAYRETDTEAALVRAADLIGQMADPFYHRKINALFYEFQENGMAEKLGYDSPMDLIECYPEFFWSRVQPMIGPALRYLEQTTEGKQWVAQLYNHVFQIEHRASCLGPFPGPADC